MKEPESLDLARQIELNLCISEIETLLEAHYQVASRDMISYLKERHDVDLFNYQHLKIIDQETEFKCAGLTLDNRIELVTYDPKSKSLQHIHRLSRWSILKLLFEVIPEDSIMSLERAFLKDQHPTIAKFLTQVFDCTFDQALVTFLTAPSTDSVKEK